MGVRGRQTSAGGWRFETGLPPWRSTTRLEVDMRPESPATAEDPPESIENIENIPIYICTCTNKPAARIQTYYVQTISQVSARNFFFRAACAVDFESACQNTH